MTEGHDAKAATGLVRVLVIDDEEIIHRSVGKVLSRAGFTSQSVFTAKEALERLRTEQFDLVITDLMMPQMNGIELLQAISDEGIQVPIIMITGYPTIGTAIKAMRYGARDYLAKPFTRRELLSPVMRALRRDQKKEKPFTRQPSAPSIDVTGLLPGARFFLPHHAWTEFQQDGHYRIGVEESFVTAAGRVARLELPNELEMVDQGSVVIRLFTADGEEHGVATPLSGQVTALNRDVVSDPARLSTDDWLIEILPSRLTGELANLVRRKSS